MTNYPIIDQRSLPKAGRRGPWGIAGPRRETSELPLPNAHEAVVYKTSGTYVVDDGRSRTTDDHVTDATNISVVDMREDAPVTVTATIPSAGATEFVVQVTFLCTVKKPEDVVEAGLRDLTAPLTQYLIRHLPLFHVGENYHLNQITEVRHNVTAEVRAYVSYRPARFRGVEVKLGNIQVMTPDEVGAKKRASEMEGLLSEDQQQWDHRLARQKTELEEDLRRREEQSELDRRRHEQEMAQMQQKVTQMEEAFQQQQERQQLAHEQLVRGSSFRHAVGEAAILKEALGAEATEMPTVIAGAIGERSMSQTADALNADRERRQEREDEKEAREQEWQHEEARYGRQVARENAQRGYDLEIARLKTQADVVVAAVNRGLADHQNVEYLMGELKSVAKQLEDASANARKSTEAAENLTRTQRPKPSTRPDRSDAQPDGDVIDAEVVSDDPGSDGGDAEPELREDDLER
jgi:hypothetical protein